MRSAGVFAGDDEHERKNCEMPATIADMINAKRAAPYDAEFEALLRFPFYCPHCREKRTLLETSVPVPPNGGDFACAVCDKQGIKAVRGDAHAVFRKVLDKLEPFDRSGNA